MVMFLHITYEDEGAVWSKYQGIASSLPLCFDMPCLVIQFVPPIKLVWTKHTKQVGLLHTLNAKLLNDWCYISLLSKGSA